jgi:AraC-like DNA-binding protein
VAFLGGPGIVYEEFAPPPELAPWVAVFWRIRSEVTFELRIPPDGCMDLIRHDVVGSLARPLTVTFRPGDTSQGVRFHPGGFPALFRMPASELVDVRLPVADVLPRFRSLRALAQGAPLPDPLARTAYHARDVRALRQATGYSERQLRRRVLAATGHGPKRLMRIARMQDVLRNGRIGSWARTAAEYGYYDEAHMASDISALAGATPHALLGDRAESRLPHRNGRAVNAEPASVRWDLSIERNGGVLRPAAASSGPATRAANLISLNSAGRRPRAGARRLISEDLCW